jgi:hypothetical protein
MARDQQLLFIKATPPLLTQRVNYLSDAPFADLAEANPLYAPLST